MDEWLARGIRAPSQDNLARVLTETSLKKFDCVRTASRCSGMNKKVYSGEFDQCGKLAPFFIWKRYIDDFDYEEDVQIFQDQYKIDPFVVPTGAEEAINRFFQAKYGLFTCQDSEDNYGGISIDPLLIKKWEVNERNLKRSWTLAILTALQSGDVKIETLGGYRNSFKQARKFTKYLEKHPQHE